jgi:predicted nucleic acid-binding protein
MSFIVDASVVFAWQFPDEESALSEKVAERMLDEGAIVPIHWVAEIANGFAMAVRRGRMSGEYRSGALEQLKSMRIEVDKDSAERMWTDTQVLCDVHNLTAYDAAYLEMALRLRLPLASLDKALVRAAQAEGVIVIGLSS